MMYLLCSILWYTPTTKITFYDGNWQVLRYIDIQFGIMYYTIISR